MGNAVERTAVMAALDFFLGTLASARAESARM